MRCGYIINLFRNIQTVDFFNFFYYIHYNYNNWVIQFNQESGEWPPQSGRVLPKQYFVHFPDLYKGTKHDGVLLGVPEEDLELVVSQ